MIKEAAQPVQVVLVFDNARSFGKQFKHLEALLDPLQKALHPHGTWKHLKGYSAPNLLGVASDNTHVTIQRFDKPMPLNGFANILSNPLITNLRPDVAKALLKHKCALLIEVGPGSVPGFTQAFAAAGFDDAMATAMDGLLGGVTTRDSYEERLLIAQAVGCALIDQMMPGAVHWGQSHQAFDGATFKRLASDGFNLLLYVGAYPYDAKQLENGNVQLGLRGLGSQALIGKMVMCAPDTKDWVENYQIMLAFIAYCRSMGRLLGDNETFGADGPDAPVYEVQHNSDIPELPDGYILLKRRCDEAPKPVALKTMTSSENNLRAAMRGKRNKLPRDIRNRPSIGAQSVGAKAQVARGAARVYKLGRLALGMAVLYFVLTQIQIPESLLPDSIVASSARP
ncbi:MAG: hypothetical protein GJ677_13705 [Rhodobacteraceae bacterium]|nr:hypothetical protein [Paracoccaceae bacterium]